jgi:hypothetical protein
MGCCFDVSYNYKSLEKLISNHSMIGLSFYFPLGYGILIHMTVTLIFTLFISMDFFFIWCFFYDFFKGSTLFYVI